MYQTRIKSFFNEYSNKFAETILHCLINIGTCDLHIVQGSLQTGESASGWDLKNMKSAHLILHDSPARKEDYASVTGSSICPFNFCATRYNLLQTIYCFTNLLDLRGIIIYGRKRHNQKSLHGQIS